MYSSFANFIQKTFKIDAHYFLKGGFWLSLRQVSIAILGLTSTALFAHYLTETEYGVYKYLLSLTTIFSAFSLTGLGQSILQTAAKGFYGFYKETLHINFTYSLGISITAIISAIYYYANSNNTLALGCVIIAIIQPLINTYTYLPSFLVGTKQFSQSTKVLVIRSFFVTVVSVITLFLTQNILLLFTSYLGSAFIINILTHTSYKPSISKKTPDNIFSKYISYAKHTSVRNTITSVASKIDNVIIFTQLGATELAVYSIATVIPQQIKGSFKILATLLLPKYAKHSNIETLKKTVPRRSFQLFLILLFLTVLYIFIAPHIYSLFFPKYEESIFYSQLSALSFVTFVFFIPYSILQSQLENRKLYKITFCNSIVQIIMMIYFIYVLGVLGAILAKLINRVFYSLIVFIFLYKK